MTRIYIFPMKLLYTKQFNQNLNLVRQTSLFNQSYRMSKKISNPEENI